MKELVIDSLNSSNPMEVMGVFLLFGFLIASCVVLFGAITIWSSKWFLE